jgi:hypothetical protein
MKANQRRDEVGAWIDGGIWYGIVVNASGASTRQLFATHLHTSESLLGVKGQRSRLDSYLSMSRRFMYES